MTSGKKALLLEGARRTDKFTVVEELAKNEYKSYILINFLPVQPRQQILAGKLGINKRMLFENAAAQMLTANGQASLHPISGKNKTRIGGCYIVHPRNLIEKDDILCIPPYMVICL